MKTFEQWLKVNGYESKEDFFQKCIKQGYTESEAEAAWYRAEDLYLFETGQ